MANLPENTQYVHKESTTIPLPKLPESLKQSLNGQTADIPQQVTTEPIAEPRDIGAERAKRQADRAKLFGGLSSALTSFASVLPKQGRSISPGQSALNYSQSGPSVSYEGGVKKVGGTASWRNNNPLNIKYGNFAMQYKAQQGSQATDGGYFAAFPSVETGYQAARDLLRAPTYANLSLEDAMRRWSGNGYGADVAPVALRTKTTGQMTDAELSLLIDSMTKREGWKAGSEFKDSPTRSSNLQMFTDYGNITTRYGGQTPISQNHGGIDIAAGFGTPIKPFVAGTVESVVTGKRKGDTDYGNYVTVRDKYGNLHYYSHLSDAWVRVGDKVTTSDYLGSEGNTGQTFSAHGGSGSHLHYEIRDAIGNRVNPETFNFGG